MIVNKDNLKVVCYDSMNSIFRGQVLSSISCPICHNSVSHTETFINITLELGGIDHVKTAFDKYCAEEVLSLQDLWVGGDCMRYVQGKTTTKPKTTTTTMTTTKNKKNS